VQRECVLSRDAKYVVGVVPAAGSDSPVESDRRAEPRAATWTRMNCPSGIYLHAVSMGSPQVGFAAGELGVVLRTTDGGDTWQYVLNQGFPYYYYGVQAFGASTVIITGFQNQTGAGVFRWSDNGGTTWGPIVSLSAPTVLDWLFFVKFSDPNHGIIQGWGGGIWYTTNGGRIAADWTFTAPTNNWWLGPFTFLPDGRAWMTGYDNFRSLNFGASWTPIADADPLFDGPNSILPNGKGLIGGGTISPSVSGWVYATTNGGDSWTPAPVLTTPYPVRALWRFSDQRAWAVGGNVYSNVGGIWGTEDGGATWALEQNTGAELGDIAAVRIDATQMDVYSVGMISHIWRTRVVVPPTPGDLNCDGAINFDDIDPFVLALSDPAGYSAAYPNCNIMNGDCDGNGVVNFDDINAFVALLGA
jgi:photosystem II stability/assembly factor-like uncharacterized protein